MRRKCLPYDAVRHAAAVALASEHADELAADRGPLPVGVGAQVAQLALHQLPRPPLLRLVVDPGEHFPCDLVCHALTPQLGGQCAPAQPVNGVPRVHPLLGERAVVDQPDVVEPLQHCVRRGVGDALAPQRLGEFLARAGPVGEQAQADRPGDALGIGGRALVGTRTALGGGANVLVGVGPGGAVEVCVTAVVGGLCVVGVCAAAGAWIVGSVAASGDRGPGTRSRTGSGSGLRAGDHGEPPASAAAAT